LKIKVLSVTVTTVPTAKGSYQMADVAFKNLTFGKVEAKKIMSFGATAAAFTTMSTAQQGDEFDVEVVKNDKGYNDWTKVSKSDGTTEEKQPAPSFQRGASTTQPARSTYETPEERAKKQVYIVRQSSISAAVATLSVGSKSVKSDDVIAMARQYESYVFGTGFDDLPASDIDLSEPEVN
jgi:hypothetical protein